MKICCPECGYSREVAEDRLPEGEVKATCPRCHRSFRFSKDLARPAVRKGGVDDPLPLGAVVPQMHSIEEENAARRAEEARRVAQEEAERMARLKVEEDAEAARRQAESEAETARQEDSREGSRRPERPAGPESWGRIPDAEGDDFSFNPWECAPEQVGWLSAFYQTCIRVMFAPSLFYSSLRPAPIARALSFYVVLSVLQVVMQRVWADVFVSYLAPVAGTDPQLAHILEVMTPHDAFAYTLIVQTGVLCFQLYAMAFMLSLFWRVAAPGKKVDFSLIVQVLAYAEAPGLLCLIPVVGSAVGFFWCIVSMVVGCRVALKLTWNETAIGFVPVLALAIPAVMQLMTLIRG